MAKLAQAHIAELQEYVVVFEPSFLSSTQIRVLNMLVTLFKFVTAA